MADNFLERRMEDMRSGRLRESVRAKGGSHGQASGAARRISLTFPDLRVLVVSDTEAALTAAVETMRSAGLRTAFEWKDKTAGNALAQKSGARFYASDAVEDMVADMNSHWGGVDFIVRYSGFHIDSDTLRLVFRQTLSMMHSDNEPIESLIIGTSKYEFIVHRRQSKVGNIPELLVVL